MRLKTKNAFSLLEMLFVIALLSIFIITTFPNLKQNKLNLAIEKLNLYIKYTRYIATINQFDPTKEDWQKQLWTIKIQRCRESVGGIYFTIYSDKDKDGHIDKIETLKDPITKKYLYSSNLCDNDSDTNNRYVLLTDTYDVTDATISCNDTTSIGQISFDQFGNVYSNLNNLNEYKLVNNCTITLYNEDNESQTINIIAGSGYSKVIKK